MKTFICAILILILFIGSAFIYSVSLDKAIDRLVTQAETVKQYAGESNWEEATRSMETLVDNWYKTLTWLKAIISHREIDLIEEYLYEVKGYTEEKNKEEVSVKTLVLITLFKRIPQNEEFSLMNILSSVSPKDCPHHIV